MKVLVNDVGTFHCKKNGVPDGRSSLEPRVGPNNAGAPYSFNQLTGPMSFRTDRTVRTAGQEMPQLQWLTPEQVGVCQNYLNRASSHVDSLRFPSLPDLAMLQQTSSPPAQRPAGVTNLVPLAQSNNVSCGQTSVAMAINSVTGKSLTDVDINDSYGFGLLGALNAESQEAGVTWKEGDELTGNSWPLIEQKVNGEQLPVIVGLNGPEFSPSGRGHIVTLVKVDGDTVYYADPADGQIKTTTKDNINNAPPHPDGKFVFYGERNRA